MKQETFENKLWTLVKEKIVDDPDLREELFTTILDYYENGAIASLQYSLNDAEKDVEIFKDEIAGLNDEINDLRDENEELSGKIADLEKELESANEL